MIYMNIYRSEKDIVSIKVKVLVTCFQLFVTPWTVAHQAPLSMKFSRQEYRSALPFPSPGDLPNPGIKPGSPSSQADSLPPGPPGNPLERGWPTSKSRGGIILSSSESEASQ